VLLALNPMKRDANCTADDTMTAFSSRPGIALLLTVALVISACACPARADESRLTGTPEADASRLVEEVLRKAGGQGEGSLGAWTRSIIDRALERAGETAGQTVPEGSKGNAAALPAERHAGAFAGPRRASAKILIFTSLSVPAANWRQWARDAARLGAAEHAGPPLVLRGVGAGGLPETAKRIGDRLGGALDVGHADPVGGVDHLALQVGEVHRVVVDHPDGADSRGSEIEEQRRAQPARADHVSDADIMSGLYRWDPGPAGMRHRATILFSGPAQAAARQAQAALAEHYDTAAELWSATSYKKLREEALDAERWNRLHPTEAPRVPAVTAKLGRSQGPITAVSDYLTLVPDQVSRWAPRHFSVLGTDGYGRSDTRHSLRRFFEVDAAHITVAVLSGLLAGGEIDASAVDDAIERFGVDPEAVNPVNYECGPLS